MFRTLLTISLLNTSFLFGVANAQSDEEKSQEIIKKYNEEKAKSKIKEIEEVDEMY